MYGCETATCNIIINVDGCGTANYKPVVSDGRVTAN